jgi:fimbrial isopeptide formation D2 family protein/LPXTG-motif cell wall-anchored protein
LYLINGTETGFEYNPMLAYVGFDTDTGAATGLKDTTLIAKKTPKTVDKTINEQTDKFVEIGDEVTYTVKATIPYLPEGATASLVINDELTGGTFKLNDDSKVVVTVSIGDEQTKEITPDGNKLTIDLSYLVTEDNDYANEEVVLTYVAIVTGEVINNTASINNNPDKAQVTSYTGKLKITKMDEAGSDSPKYLPGAVFVVVNESGKYAKLSEGKLAGWVDDITDDCKITTGSDGTATVSGFDVNKTYKFHEVVAPEGYKINSEDVTAEWVAGQADDKQIAEATMHDTKLSKLPYTGGKGTAAFTIFGVLLMGIAAGLYYVNKRNKSAK